VSIVQLESFPGEGSYLPVFPSIRLVATEVDLFVNDVAEVQRELVLACPGPAGGTLTKELDIDVEVRELPQILPRKAVFTLRVRFNLTCA